MQRNFIFLILIGLLSACSQTDGTNPFNKMDNEDQAGDQVGDAVTPTDQDGVAAPDTNAPLGIFTDGLSPPTMSKIDVTTSAITRAQGDADSYSYDSVNDQLFINNLPFDGLQSDAYSRYAFVPTSDGFGIYRSVPVVTDSMNENISIEQHVYRAIYVSSPSGGSQAMVVKTGSYRDEGFGGYIYQRTPEDLAGNSTQFTMPASGQAVLIGGYQGLIVYKTDEKTRLDHVKGDSKLVFDFDDFDTSPAVAFQLTNRQIFDDDGLDISGNFSPILQENADGSTSFYHFPVTSVVTKNTVTSNGEFSGQLLINGDLNAGSYYGILSGPNADEAIGIVELQWSGPNTSGITARETGAFVATRPKE